MALHSWQHRKEYAHTAQIDSSFPPFIMNQILYCLFIEWKPHYGTVSGSFVIKWAHCLITSPNNIKNNLVYLNFNHSLTTVFWRKEKSCCKKKKKKETDASPSCHISIKWCRTERSCWIVLNVTCMLALQHVKQLPTTTRAAHAHPCNLCNLTSPGLEKSPEPARVVLQVCLHLYHNEKGVQRDNSH